MKNNTHKIQELLKELGLVVVSDYTPNMFLVKDRQSKHVLLFSAGKKYFRIHAFLKNNEARNNIRTSVIYKERINNLLKAKVVSKIIKIYFSEKYFQFSQDIFLESLNECKNTSYKKFSLSLFKDNLTTDNLLIEMGLSIEKDWENNLKISSHKFSFSLDISVEKFLTGKSFFSNSNMNDIIDISDNEIRTNKSKFDTLVLYLVEYQKILHLLKINSFENKEY
jgi:hypothetical protein